MGNCQAIDNASFVLQTQNGRAERFYAPVSAAEMMKLHPGHHVALLLTTTFYSSPPPASSSNHHHHHHHRHPNNNNNNKSDNNNNSNNNQPLRVTRIKLLRPTDNLVLGHAYRLITTQEVMKGIKAKKNGKLNNKNYHQQSESNSNCDQASAIKSLNQSGKTHHQMRRVDKDRPIVSSKSTGNKPRGWHPSLNSISEITS
uniref:uncharacterized protein DDB_G0283357 n=1 Tax=Erigeron canadensis TaxID=72917 RepID=UPI001CB9A267|nr:uncharacterized protein DDB_G0283357 [Erigeron canadensis]